METTKASGKIRAAILDMDGVLWRESKPIVDLVEVFTKINNLGWKVLCLTNNSTKHPQQYLALLREYKVSLEDWQVISSSQAAAEYLQGVIPNGQSVYVIGENGLVEALQMQGFQTIQGKSKMDQVSAVVVGLDRELTYQKIATAANFIRKGALFIGTNPDNTFPASSGVMPGAGTVIKAVETAAGKDPVMIGKPAKNIFNTALDRLGCEPDEVLMIGDRLETDIFGAQQVGCQTAVVLSGIANRDQVLHWSPRPDWVAENILLLLQEIGK